MKLRTSQKIHYDTGPNMTPLVDIVMVILIFLMLTGTFAVGEHFLVSNVPVTRRGVGGQVSSSVPLDEPLEIRVDSSTSGDQWIAQAGSHQVRNSPESLAKLLRNLREAMNAAGTPTSRIQIVINPGRNTKYKHLVQVYEAALDAEYTKVAFSRAH